MCHGTAWGQCSATAQQRNEHAARIVDHTWLQVRGRCIELVAQLLIAPLAPAQFLRWELTLLVVVREFGRHLLQDTLNALEPERSDLLPRHVWLGTSCYVQRREKTRNGYVATLFGTVELWRRGYRSCDKTEKSIFPLELLLGLVEGTTPALASWLGRQMADAGASQGRVQERLREEHQVSMGVKRLRQLIDKLSEGMAEFRESNQADALLVALEQANNSSGSRKPVLAVGRDGITLREYRQRCFEVATAGTVSVYDRAGKRLTTIYLAWPPQLGQAMMDGMLTDLLKAVLRQWQGPMPQLAYVADSGGNESTYYEDQLRRMRHPRTGKRLHWQRVVDYYHVAERIWSMASILHGKDTRESISWARRMLKALKKPSGASRVLHSAASLFHRRTFKTTAAKDFWKAYRYIQKRTRYLNYHDYAARHIPLGSGVTEAACKTIFTQRLKLSGMRWSHAGAKTILNLRVILLSGTWDATFSTYLNSLPQITMRPYATTTAQNDAIVA